MEISKENLIKILSLLQIKCKENYFLFINFINNALNRIDLNARNIDIRKARTNQFNAITKENFLIRSSLEANKLDIKSRYNIDITK